MNKLALAAVAITASLAGIVVGAGRAHARSTYYADTAILGGGESCATATCHGATPTTCGGCHAHGTHAGATEKASINILAAPLKSVYVPGEAVSVEVTGGYRGGWLRVDLFDELGNRLATASQAEYPVTLTAFAPTTPGPVRWRAAWYGNQYDVGFPEVTTTGTYGSGTSATIEPGYFTPDPYNAAPPHGWQTVAVTAFTVQDAPGIALSPASLAFGAVLVGGSRSLAVEVDNTGTVPLDVTSIARCAGTPADVTWTPSAPLSIAPGGSVALEVTYSPVVEGSLPTGACLAIASNDPNAPGVNVGLSGNGATTVAPAIALVPAALAFGAFTAGTARTLPVELENTGNAALTVSSVSLCGGTPAVITWTPAIPPPIAAGASATLEVTYAPTSADALPAGACLLLASDDPAHPTIALAVSGSAAGPAGGEAGGGGGCNSGATGGGVLVGAALGLRVLLRARGSRGSSADRGGAGTPRPT